MSHHFHDENTAMGCGCGVNAVDGVGRHVYGALKSEGHVSAPQIIVYGLGQGYDVQSFLTQQVGRLLASIAAKHHQALQL